MSEEQIDATRKPRPMTGGERFRELLSRVSEAGSDFESDSVNITEEAYKMASDWAWSQLTPAEQRELQMEEAENTRREFGVRYMDRLVREGRAESFINEAGKKRYRMLD